MPDKSLPKLNPWTGQKMKAKSDGKFFSIIAEHYPHLSWQNNLQKGYKNISVLIQAQKNEHRLPQHQDLIDIESKVKKINEILEWIKKIQFESDIKPSSASQSKNEIREEKTPIDSSFVYLPLHSGTIFHELLKEGSSLRWDGLVPDRIVKKITQQLNEMSQILRINDEIMKNIII